MMSPMTTTTLTRDQRRALRRLDPDRPLLGAGLVIVRGGRALGRAGWLIAAGGLPAPAWSVLA